MKAAEPKLIPITFVFDALDIGVAGAGIGTHAMNAFMPDRFLILGHRTLGDVLPTSGGAPTISVGFTGTTAGLLALTAIAGFGNGVVLPGVDFQPAPLYFADAIELTVTVAVAIVATGRFKTTVYGLQYPTRIV